MRILGYCVAVAALVFLALNGGEEATTTAWALSLGGIITALALLVHGNEHHKLGNQ